MNWVLFSLILVFVLGVAIMPNVFAEGVPDWVKNTAGWWASDAISETEFVNAIQFLVNEGIIFVSVEESDKNELEDFFKKPLLQIPRDELNAQINSHGFRGSEIVKEKQDDIFRIFAFGGSTTFSTGVEDEFTWPNQLQNRFDDLDTELKIEVVNAGYPGATSFSNVKLLKERVVDFNPDLVIFYEGVNDQGCLMPPFQNQNTLSTEETIFNKCGIVALQDYSKHISERYAETCSYAKENKFEMLVIMQPSVKLNGKILTDQEIDSYFHRPQYPVLTEDYEKIINSVLKIKECYNVKTFYNIFDTHNIPVYHDYHHVGNTGNAIVAENVFKSVLPLLKEKNIIKDEQIIFKDISKGVKSIPNVLDNVDFSNQDLTNSDFFASDLTNSDFSNSQIINVDFRLSNLEGADFSNSELRDIKLRQNQLKGADFSNVDFSNVDLTNVDLSFTNLSSTDLSNKNLQHTFLHKSNLSGANLSKSNLENGFLYGVDLRNTDLRLANLVSIDFSMIKNKDLETANINSAAMSHTNLRGVILPDQMETVNFSKANMNSVDLSNKKIIGSIFEITEMQNANLQNLDFSDEIKRITLNDFGPYPPIGIPENEIPNYIKNKISPFPNINIIGIESVENDLRVLLKIYNVLIGSDLSNANLSNADLTYVDLTYANLSNANLKNTILKDAFLKNANLEGANLEGANLEGANLECMNHPVCNLE